MAKKVIATALSITWYTSLVSYFHFSKLQLSFHHHRILDRFQIMGMCVKEETSRFVRVAIAVCFAVIANISSFLATFLTPLTLLLVMVKRRKSKY